MKKIKWFYRFAAVLLLLAFSGGTTWAGTGGYGRKNINTTTVQTIHNGRTDTTDQTVNNSAAIYNNLVDFYRYGGTYEGTRSLSEFVFTSNEYLGGCSDPDPNIIGSLTYNENTNTFSFSDISGTYASYATNYSDGVWFYSPTDSSVGQWDVGTNPYGNVGFVSNFSSGPEVQSTSSATTSSTSTQVTGTHTDTSTATSSSSNGPTVLSGHRLITINANNETVTITHVTDVTQTTTNTTTTTVDQIVGEVLAYSPIILDLSGTGKPDVAHRDWLPHAPTFYPNRVAYFDMLGIGQPQLSEWVGPKDGLLVIPNKNGKVTSALQLFGTAGGWDNGYQKLAALFDKNHTGVIKGEELKGLYVWIDKNGNGKVDPGELYTVQQLGITEISDQHKNMKSWYIRNGKKYDTWDWWPSVFMLRKMRKIKGVPMSH
jgi:hypothetical protein